MGIKRIVDVSFWTDGKVDDFSPEDKYFMLYLLTNPFSKQLGIYEISIKQAAFQMGYSVDAFNVLLDRFENKYNIILFSKETNEIAILNFLRHSVMKGGKPVEDCIKKDMELVKNKSLIDFVFSHLYGRDGLNETVKKIVNDYVNENHNDNHNDNDNDNDRTVDESFHESLDESSDEPPYQPRKKISDELTHIVNMFNSICTSLPSVRSLSEARKKAIKARLNTYTLDDFKQCFENAQASSFLRGSNPRNWTATFDWLIKDANMAKVLDGNYVDNKNQSSNSSFEVDDFWNAALEKTYGKKKGAIPPRTAIEREVVARMEENAQKGAKPLDPEYKERVEKLKKELQGG